MSLTPTLHPLFPLLHGDSRLGKWRLAQGQIPDEPSAGQGRGQQHGGDSPGPREERTDFHFSTAPWEHSSSCNLQIARLPRNCVTSPGLSDGITAQLAVGAGAGAQPSFCQALCCPQSSVLPTLYSLNIHIFPESRLKLLGADREYK